MSTVKRLPREQAFHVEYGGHMEPELRVALGETFVVETNDNGTTCWGRRVPSRT